MNDFLIYDLVLLFLFVVLLFLFLYRGRKNLKKEGLLLLYKTSWGIKLIDKIGKKYKKTLQVLSYVSVGLGYLLMAGALYFVGKIVWIYLKFPEIGSTIKVPPIIPLVPYLPEIFKINFLPPFYFTYWIIIIAIIAITHEVAHGIFAAKSKIKIKSTGFGFFPFFFPVFLAAFVEPDDKKMSRKKIFEQLSVLSAGTFANFLTAILFLLVLVGFFFVAFTPSGVVYDSYAYMSIPIGAVVSVNNLKVINPTYDNILEKSGEGYTELKTRDGSFLITRSMLEKQKDENYLYVFHDAPAINSDLGYKILEINGVKIDSLEKLTSELYEYSPGEKVSLRVLGKEEIYNKDIVLGKHPREDKAFIGISFKEKDKGILGDIFLSLPPLKIEPSDCSRINAKSNTCYAPKLGGLSFFIYDLLRWIIIISLSVAFINMLPVGIFDGGRYLYLTVLALTKNKKMAERVFRISTYVFLILLLVLLVAWVRAIT